ncbi:ATP-binding protein [Zooshikella harenae]|uniref:histidine kinase n=1 Tax=Zooshikella harenae TaxID=2827238 RepID=A0ABS5ZGS7_9GAMM|nr:DUF3404 domain-containing protein [Zooshikella harenae]MBU2712983.1 DUF3404 domain-containing protein [Zooshikella harenae]
MSLPANAFNDTTQQLYSELNTEVPSHEVAIDMLQQFDSSQLNPAKMHPQTHLYVLADIQALYRFYQLCAQPADLAMDNPLAKTESFITALCLQQELPISWFASGTLIHPGGGSFAFRYSREHPEQFNQLKPYMHIRELDNDYFTNDLDDNQLQALTRSAQWIMGQQFLWVKFPNEYRLYQHQQWRPLVDSLNLEIHPISQREKCSFIEGSICWLEKSRNGMWLYTGLTILGVLLLGYIFLVIITRHKYYKERQFIVQMLAHELRTPITRLAGTVEIFRTHFDELPDNLHHAFTRLCKDALHLRHLADASKQYLQLDYGANLQKQYIESWHVLMQEVLSEYEIDLELKDDKPVCISIYWFSLCLKNLVGNAVKHGKGQVLVKSYCVEKRLVIVVQDQGNLSSRKLSKFMKPFNSQHGVGLGLHLVSQVVLKMGGKLRLQGPPTTFVLEVPINEPNTTHC